MSEYSDSSKFMVMEEYKKERFKQRTNFINFKLAKLAKEKLEIKHPKRKYKIFETLDK